MTVYSKPRMIGLLQSFVVDCINNCWFSSVVVNFLAYDYENIGTDWDNIDAIGLILMRIVDMKRLPEEEDQSSSYEEMMSLGSYEVINGEIYQKGQHSDGNFSSMEDESNFWNS